MTTITTNVTRQPPQPLLLLPEFIGTPPDIGISFYYTGRPHNRIEQMKNINTPGQALDPGGVASFSAQGAVNFTLLSRHSLGIGTIKILPLRSLRWGINSGDR
jgi:hypothetical protein